LTLQDCLALHEHRRVARCAGPHCLRFSLCLRCSLGYVQMMNTIEYRVDCQLLQHLHNENHLGCRWVRACFLDTLPTGVLVLRGWPPWCGTFPRTRMSSVGKVQHAYQWSRLHMHVCALICRFPIGKVEQVDQWSRDQLLAFWKKWYFPANATLYVVGDLDRSTAELEDLIKQTFGRRPPGVVRTWPLQAD